MDLKRPYHAIFDNESVFVVDSHNSRVLFVERPVYLIGKLDYAKGSSDC